MSFWFDFSEARCVYTLPLKSILCKSKVGECLKGHCWFKLIFSDNAFWILYHEAALFIQIYFFPPAYHLLIYNLLQKPLLVTKGILLLCSPGAPCAVCCLLRGRVVALVCCSCTLVGLGRWQCMSRARHPRMNHKGPVIMKPVICKVLSSQTSKKANDVLN